MRLLNVYTLKFAEFERDDLPRYAITSHRWSRDEACLKDVLKTKNTSSEGFKKLEGFCQFVRHENERKKTRHRSPESCDWIWLDTVCIDKKNAPEVSEAINSMFRWYRRAKVCYAYLSDVREVSDFARSAWFTRGWTLQELIAPKQVVFLTAGWEVLGTTGTSPSWESFADLGDLVADITGVPRHIFSVRDEFPLEALSVAERSKWIQNRETTKIEDMAYCLLGVLGVTMPLIYGEGSYAWVRLEEEVTKRHGIKISLPWPNSLNKRDSGRDFLFWSQPMKAPKEPALIEGVTASPNTVTGPSSPTTAPMVMISTQKSRQSSGSLARDQTRIPSWYPSELGDALLEAAADGDESRLISLLRNGAALDYRDRSGLTALHHASLRGHGDVANFSMTAGADVNAQSLELGTPLCLSALRGHQNIVNVLLKSEARIDEAGRWTGTPLHCASWGGYVEVAAALLRYGADLTLTNTIWPNFLKYGSSLGYSSPTETDDKPRGSSKTKHQIFECQSLIVAADRSNEALVQLFLRSDLHVDTEYRSWWTKDPDIESFDDINEDDRFTNATALMAASWKGPHTLLTKLLNAGAVVNRQDSWGRSALWIAAQAGQFHCVRSLAEAGADLYAISSTGKSALHGSIDIGHPEIVKYLVEQGADVDRADRRGWTPCHFAAFRGTVPVLEILLKHDARYSFHDSNGFTPAHLAVQRGGSNLPAIRCLIKHGANLLAADDSRRTPLHYAAAWAPDAVLAMLDAGADATTRDCDGLTALDYLSLQAPAEVRRILTYATSGRSLSDSSVYTITQKGSRTASKERIVHETADQFGQMRLDRSGSV